MLVCTFVWMSGILSERIEMKLTIEQERQITAQYQYIKELATLKYDAEEKENKIWFNSPVRCKRLFIHDSSCVCSYGYLHRIPGKADFEFFPDSSIYCYLLLIVSLLLASIAQWRWKTEAFPDIQDIKNTVVNDPEWEKLTIKYHQINQWIDMVGKVQKKKRK